jgi:hypothetical protein
LAAVAQMAEAAQLIPILPLFPAEVAQLFHHPEQQEQQVGLLCGGKFFQFFISLALNQFRHLGLRNSRQVFSFLP